MAIQEVRVDDVTGEAGAEAIVIDVAGSRWSVDLVATSLKQLLDAIRPWTDAGVALPPGSSVEEEAAPSTDAGLPADPPPPPPAGGDGAAIGPTDLTPKERALCRAWCLAAPQRVLNRYEAERPKPRGPLSRNAVAAWIGEGRPE